MRQTQRVTPERAGRVNELHYAADSTHKGVNLRLAGNQGRRGLQYQEVIAAQLCEDSVLAEEAHHQHLAKHGGMDDLKGFEWHFQFEASGALELYSIQHSQPADFTHHF